MSIAMISTFIIFNLLAGINHVIEAFTIYTDYREFRIPLGNLLVCVNRYILFRIKNFNSI